MKSPKSFIIGAFISIACAWYIPYDAYSTTSMQRLEQNPVYQQQVFEKNGGPSRLSDEKDIDTTDSSQHSIIINESDGLPYIHPDPLAESTKSSKDRALLGGNIPARERILGAVGNDNIQDHEHRKSDNKKKGETSDTKAMRKGFHDGNGKPKAQQVLKGKIQLFGHPKEIQEDGSGYQKMESH